MSLEIQDWEWLHTFSGGAIKIPPEPEPDLSTLSKEDREKRLQERARQLLERELKARQTKELAAEQMLKQTLLAAAAQRLGKRREEMRKAFDMNVKVAGTLGEKSIPTRAKDGDQRKAYDTEHHAGKVAEVPKGLTSAQELWGVVAGEATALAGNVTWRSCYDEKTNSIQLRSQPLFSEKEIGNEIFAPLVREKIVPENFVPAKYSETQRMLDGSNEAYIEECKEKGKKIGVKPAELAKGSIDLARSITSTILKSMAPVSDGVPLPTSGKLGSEESAHAAQLTSGLAALLTGGVMAIEVAVDIKEQGVLPSGGFNAVADKIGLAVGRIVAGAINTPDAHFIGLAVTDGVAGAVAACNIPAVIYKWAMAGEKGKFPWDAIVESIGTAIASGLAVKSDRSSEVETATEFTVASVAVSAIVEGAAKAVEEDALEAYRKRDWKVFLDLFQGAVVKGCEAGLVEAMTITVDKKEYEEATTFAEVVKIGTNSPYVNTPSQALTTDKAAGQMAGGADTIIDAFRKKEKELSKKRVNDNDSEIKKQNEDLNKKLAEERKEFLVSLDCLGSKSPTDSEFKSIARLIQQIEKDRVIWKAIFAIADGGNAVAEQIVHKMAEQAVPGLKMIGETMKFVANIKAAADRCEAMIEWIDARKDAKSAVSPYASSIESMIRNQAEQFTQYSLQAAANAIQVILAAGELSPYAPAFKIAGSAVGAAAAGEALLYKVYKQEELIRAWRRTKKALANPHDRVQGLMAREINPTLAKYTIAYGALIEQDQVAISACERIGLDRETLARAGDKVAEVKKFMQTLYNEDNVVLGRVDLEKGDVAVPKPILTPEAWALSHMTWREKKNLAGENPPRIMAYLAKVKQLDQQSKAKGLSSLTDGELESYQDAVEKLSIGFRDYEPRGGSDKDMENIKNYVREYSDLADARLEAVKDEMFHRKAAVQ